MADFHATVTACSTHFDDTGVMAANNKCPAEPAIDQDDTIRSSCSWCRVQGRICSWQGWLSKHTEGGEIHS